MPNLIDANGLQTATHDELDTTLTTALEKIYGSDINLDSDTPDGQMKGIYIQGSLDEEDLLTQIYNMFDPDNAIGVILDQRVAINGIQRQAGTYTVTNVTLTVTRALNLYGLDQSTQPVYTVADNAGNQWQLQTTQLGVVSGTHVYSFQAAQIGAVLSVPNTIVIPVTIVLGVSAINNPTSYTSLGLAEESDAALKIRRQKSVSLASQGYLAGLYAALNNINGITSVNVYENNTDTTDGDGVPSHSIWVVVAGTASSAEIANAIYRKRNAGCGMFGAETYVVTQIDGTLFTVRWDTVSLVPLFIKFTATSLDGINPPNIAAILENLPLLYVPGVAEQVNITQLGTYVQDIDPNTLVTLAGFSTAIGGSYTNTLTPSSKAEQFVITPENIVIIPMVLLPATATVISGEDQQFTGYGGYGAYTYSIFVNNSGGTIDSVTGLYTAGVTTSVNDTIKVVDSLANSATAIVTVI